MNVAIATSASANSSVIMTAHNGNTVGSGPSPQTPSVVPHPQEPLVNRFPLVAYKMDSDVERLVMLFRDPATGVTIDQIPSEAALRQYKEAQTGKRADNNGQLAVTVGGEDRNGDLRSEKLAGQRRKAVAMSSRDFSAPAHLAPVNHTASAPGAPVSVRPAQTSGASAAPRVNMVI